MENKVEDGLSTIKMEIKKFIVFNLIVLVLFAEMDQLVLQPEEVHVHGMEVSRNGDIKQKKCLLKELANTNPSKINFEN